MKTSHIQSDNGRIYLQHEASISRRQFIERSIVVSAGLGLSACASKAPGYAQEGAAEQSCEIPAIVSGNGTPNDFGIHLDPGQQAFLVEHKVRDGDQSRKVALITYDDWATELEFNSILSAFRRYPQSRATFFFNGSHLSDMAASVEKAALDGHLIGYHGWCHVNMGIYSEKEVDATFAAYFNTMRSILPGYKLKYFRMPYGNTKDAVKDQMILKIAAEWGLQHIYWSFYTDGTKNNVQKIVKDNLRTGSIILCHMNYRYDLVHTPWMIESLLNDGYALETIDTGISPDDQRSW